MTLGKMDILLVEDNQDDEELALLGLERNGITDRIHVVRDGAEALDCIFGTGEYEGRDVEQKPKLILLDLKLPKIDGIQVLERIKEDARTRKIPVVILTSSKEDPDVDRCYELGANSYIVKPVDYEKFIKVIGELGLYWLVHNEPPH